VGTAHTARGGLGEKDTRARIVLARLKEVRAKETTRCQDKTKGTEGDYIAGIQEEGPKKNEPRKFRTEEASRRGETHSLRLRPA